MASDALTELTPENKVISIQLPEQDDISYTTYTKCLLISYDLGFDASGYAYCDISGMVLLYFEVVDTSVGPTTNTCNFSNINLVYNIETDKSFTQVISIIDGTSTRHYFSLYFLYTESNFQVHYYTVRETMGPIVQLKSCNITANFHN